MTLGKFKKNKQASKMSSTANDVSSVEKNVCRISKLFEKY